MLGAGAAAADTLVKNLAQTTSASVANLSNRDLSQAFTTGSTADAYELTGVKVQFGTVPGSTATVTAFIADGQGTSDDIIANLTNPPTWTTTSTFTAPDGITLDANTTYHLIIDVRTEGTLATTASDSEDSGGVTGWSIADAQTQRSMVSDRGSARRGQSTLSRSPSKATTSWERSPPAAPLSMQNRLDRTMTGGTASFAGFTFQRVERRLPSEPQAKRNEFTFGEMDDRSAAMTNGPQLAEQRDRIRQRTAIRFFEQSQHSKLDTIGRRPHSTGRGRQQ